MSSSDNYELKDMKKDKKVKNRIIHRLKITHGHLNKVIQMIEEDTYCIDIIHQLIAIQSALRKTDHLILENHLKTCVSEAIKKGKKDEVIKEVMKVMEK